MSRMTLLQMWEPWKSKRGRDEYRALCWRTSSLQLDLSNITKNPQFHTISYNNRHDLWQLDINKSDNEDLEDGSETCYDLWFEDGSSEKKEAGVEGKDVQILE